MDPRNIRPSQGRRHDPYPSERAICLSRPIATPGTVDFRASRFSAAAKTMSRRYSIDQQNAEPSLQRNRRRPRIQLRPSRSIRRAACCSSRPAFSRCSCATGLRRKCLAGLSVYRIDETGDGKLVRAQIRRRYRERHAVLERNGDAGLAADYDAACSRTWPLSL